MDKNKLFLVRRRALEDKLAPKFFKPNKIDFFKKVNQYPFIKKLKSIIDKGSYGILPKGDCYNEKEPISLLRATELNVDFKVNLEDTFKVPIEYYRHKRARLRKNDILIAVKGATIASKKSIAFIDEDVKNTIINGSIFRFQVNEKAIPKYVAYLLDLPLLKNQMKFNLIANNAVDYLDKPLIFNLKIPVPPLETQHQIVELFQIAYDTKRQKEAEAKALLASIDDYLLKALGIELAAPTAKRNSFFVKWSEVSGGRFDPAFFEPKYNRITNAIKTSSYQSLGNIISFSSETWNGKTYFEDTFPYIEISEIDLKHGLIKNIREIPINEAPSRAKMIVRDNDILVSTTRPSRGAITLVDFENEEIKVASTGFAVLRNPKIENLNKAYLFYILRNKMILTQMEQRSSGGNYPAINSEELKKILIPLPTLEVQNSIVEHISNIQNQAQQLKTEAKTIIEEAKATVEQIILGNPQENG